MFNLHLISFSKLLIFKLKIYGKKSLFYGNFILGFLQKFLRKIDENWGKIFSNLEFFYEKLV